jgi:hypothetical protein
MDIWPKFNSPFLVLPLGHLVFCLAAKLMAAVAGPWPWLILAAVDYPVILIVGDDFFLLHSFVTVACLGTMWWYLISVLLSLFRLSDWPTSRKL